MKNEIEILCTKKRKRYLNYLEEYVKEIKENILDIINSENSGLSHQARLNEIEELIKLKE